MLLIGGEIGLRRAFRYWYREETNTKSLFDTVPLFFLTFKYTSRAKDSHQWTQADPLTSKRVASVKKLAYYVQNQLEQAQKSLDYKWNEAVTRDTQFNK